MDAIKQLVSVQRKAGILLLDILARRCEMTELSKILVVSSFQHANVRIPGHFVKLSVHLVKIVRKLSRTDLRKLAKEHKNGVDIWLFIQITVEMGCVENVDSSPYCSTSVFIRPPTIYKYNIVFRNNRLLCVWI